MKKIVDFTKIFNIITINILNNYNILIKETYPYLDLEDPDTFKIFTHYFIKELHEFYKNNKDSVIIIHSDTEICRKYYDIKVLNVKIARITKNITKFLPIMLIFTQTSVDNKIFDNKYIRDEGERIELLNFLDHRVEKTRNKPGNNRKFRKFLQKQGFSALEKYFSHPENHF